MIRFMSQIVSNERINDAFFEMSFQWDVSAPVPLPGQFLTIRLSLCGATPLLRRPFAFADFDEQSQTVSIVYQIRGDGTKILSEMSPGKPIDVIGPLGNAFPVDGGAKRAVVVAGGVGVGPILFLYKSLKKRNIDAEFIFGCKSEAFIPKTAAFSLAAARICTDDGTVGFKGNVVQYMEANVKIDGETAVYGCGPTLMLKNLSELKTSASAPVWVSLEGMMACGVGACMGCVAPATNGYVRLCKDGAVFNGKDILWEQIRI